MEVNDSEESSLLIEFANEIGSVDTCKPAPTLSINFPNGSPKFETTGTPNSTASTNLVLQLSFVSGLWLLKRRTASAEHLLCLPTALARH